MASHSPVILCSHTIGISENRNWFGPSGVRPQRFPKGYCFAYCSYGRSSNAKCSFLHRCPTCNGQHALFQCRDNGPLSSHALLSPSIAPPSLSNNLLSPASRLLTQVHTARLLHLLPASNYDAVLSMDIWQGFTYGFPIFVLGDLSERSVPCNHPSLLDNLPVAKEMISCELKLSRITPFLTSLFPHWV